MGWAGSQVGVRVREWREGRSRRWELMSTGLGCVVATAGDQDVFGRRGFVFVGLWWVLSVV